MKFSEKLKKLRNDNNITQEELAEKIYVTRTAISKWETDVGYPSLESLKMLSKVFNVSLDELVSDEYIENKKLLDDRKAKKFYWCSFACLIAAFVFAVVFAVTLIKYIFIPLVVFTVAYVVFATLSKPKYKRKELKLINIILYFVVIAITVGISIYSLILIW